VSNALIGHTGFVGSNLTEQFGFDRFFNSRNFRDMEGASFDLIVCAGLPAEKWRINQEPEKDQANIVELTNTLSTVRSAHFVLISTIDVYPASAGLDEDFDCSSIAHPQPYGRHRMEFETAIKDQFSNAAIIRLPGLFGPGLKKNVIFDVINNNRLDMIDPESIFQWYSISRLWADITRIQNAGIRVCNFFPQPIVTRDIVDRFFPGTKISGNPEQSVCYDLRTRHSKLFDCSKSGYIQTAEQVLTDLDAWLATNPDGT